MWVSSAITKPPSSRRRLADSTTPQLSHVYHAAPLHYVPSIFETGTLFAAGVLAANRISPRSTAARRDRMLGLSEYVHFSTTVPFPLLEDKINKGYPHVIFKFPIQPILDLPGTALLPYNTKAWHTKAAYELVTERLDQEHLIKKHLELGRNPSMEVLAKYGVTLHLAETALFQNKIERELIEELLSSIGIVVACELKVDDAAFGCASTVTVCDYTKQMAYFASCREANRILTPPEIPFD
jgi:hypothetical protein